MKKNERNFWLASIITIIVSLLGLAIIGFVPEIEMIGVIIFFSPILISLMCTLGTTPKKVWKNKDGFSGLIVGGYPATILALLFIIYSIIYSLR